MTLYYTYRFFKHYVVVCVRVCPKVYVSIFHDTGFVMHVYISAVKVLVKTRFNNGYSN